MNNELERIWKEAANTKFLGLSWHVPWETQDKQENLIQSSLSQAQI
jgi:hypothetical protein